MPGNVIPTENFNRGGLADSKWSGVEFSLYKLTGWDIHSTPGLLKVAQKMTAETAGSPPTEFCKAPLNSSNGAQYWGSSTSGKIWERPTSGTWRLVHTVTAGAGESKILGMVEYQGYIYVFTESKVHRITVAEADDNDWGNDLTEDWATFTVTDKELHPYIEQNQVLYIGDGNLVAQVNGNTFTADALDIKTPLRIKSFGRIATDVLLGTYVADNVTQTEIIRWNTSGVSYSTSDTIPEVGINAFLPADNFVIVQAGNQGNLYYYDGDKLEEYLKIPGDYSPTAYGEVYPTAVGSLGGKILFGFSNGSGNPADQGIYQIARSTRNHDYILDFPYPTSLRTGDDSENLVLTGTEIGGILIVGTDVYASFKNGANIGIDKLDYSNKMELAYFETRVMSDEREKLSNFSKIAVAYASLPEDTGITIEYEKNYSASFTETSEVTDPQRKIVYVEDKVEATTFRLKVSPTVSGNDAPQIESAGVFLS